MNDVELLLRFLQHAAGLSALCWDGTEKMLAETAKKHCFSSQAQPQLTVPGLNTVLTHMQPAVAYELEDILGVHLFAFVFQERPILVGPFVTAPWRGLEAEVILTQAGLSVDYLPAYQFYYSGYTLLDWKWALQVVMGCITALLPEAPPYSYRRIPWTQGQMQPDLQPPEPPDFDDAVLRYEGENKFLALVEEGRTEEAVEFVKRIDEFPMAQELAGPGLHVIVANATSMRTMVRKAAERGGVHPAVVDAIALSYAQKMYAVRSAKELHAIMPAMVREFTNAVRAARAGGYSPVIRRVVSYLRLHISQRADAKKLAADAGYTSRYLGRRFKEETGLTMAQFLARERCRKAAGLLAETDISVQEISAYVGYLDNNYFVKVFKSCMGDTPTAYRNQFRR